MVKRYQPNWNAGTNSHGVHDAVDGEFVRYSDYAALEAQLAERVKVKPLEWIHAKGNLAGQEVWSSGDPWVFWIVKNPNERFVWCESFGLEDHIPASPVRGIFDTLADAKAAAQADFDRRIISALEATPPVPKVTEAPKIDGAVAELFVDAWAESEKAMRKFPQPNYVISKVAEEAGEVVKAAIHCAEGRETPETVVAEIKQAMAMLIRLYLEGDQVHGLLPLTAAQEAGKP